MQGRARCVSLNTISNLPLPIIENILCFLPIKEAVRTSILSRNWRYNWTGIPKLVFDEGEMFKEGDKVSKKKLKKGKYRAYEKKHNIVSAIHQVLSLHRGPLIEFSISMISFAYAELDQIINDLERSKDTLKKLTLHSRFKNGVYSYKLPLSIFSFQQLTFLYFSHCRFELDPTFSALGNLTSLYFHSSFACTKALLHLLSNCPLLKRLKLAFEEEGHYKEQEERITFHKLSKCLPVIEHLSFNCRFIQCCFQEYAGRELPTALVNLKCISLFGIMLFDNSPLLCHVLRSSPNLEKITLTIYRPDKVLESNMGDCSDVWLQNLNELKISCFNNLEGEIRFIKLILAKSPALKKVIIEGWSRDADKQLETLRTLLQSPRASSAAEIISTNSLLIDSWNDHGFSEGLGVVDL